MPEVYTLRAPENFTNRSDRRLSPAVRNPSRSNDQRSPEMFYLKSTLPKNHRISNHRSSSTTVKNKQKSPRLNQSSYGQRPEMYHLRVEDENIPTSYANDIRQQPKLHGDSDKQKVTMYTLTTADEDNPNSVSLNTPRIPSPPPTHRRKKKHYVSFDLIDDNDDTLTVSNEQRRIPADVYDVHTNVRYERLSKASESIQRSMSKYRFSGS